MRASEIREGAEYRVEDLGVLYTVTSVATVGGRVVAEVMYADGGPGVRVWDDPDADIPRVVNPNKEGN